MRHPQTLAAQLYEQFPNAKLKTIRDNACCAFVLLWCLGYDKTDSEAIMTVSRMMSLNVIGDDCTVFWQKAILFLKGSNSIVDFVPCSEIKKIKQRTPVRYMYNGKCHWVGVEKGKIAFNPLEKSNCVEYGKPDTMRVITLLKAGKK